MCDDNVASIEMLEDQLKSTQRFCYSNGMRHDEVVAFSKGEEGLLGKKWTVQWTNELPKEQML